MIFNRAPKFLIHFNHGAFIKQLSGNKSYTVRFIAGNDTIFKGSIKKNAWLNTHIKYFVDWQIRILDQTGKCIIEHKLNLNNKSVRINIDSKSLGDTLAWVPQIAEFASRHPQTRIYVSQFLSGTGLQSAYPQYNFIAPETALSDVYATYNIGYYFDNLPGHHPHDPRKRPLSQVASDILGIPYREIRPKLMVKDKSRIRNPAYVCIATQSTAGCKLWQYKNGWQAVVDYLHSVGLLTVVIQREPTDLKNVIDQTGSRPLQSRMRELLHCEFFIGLGSGLSWLAWALEKRVILVSGFSLPYSEFTHDCTRIINTDVCHGCWNSAEHLFDRSDWNWCPHHKDTSRQFECSKSIKPESVFKAIDSLLRHTQ